MDYLLKALALDDQVRVYICNTKDLVNEAIVKNDTYPSTSSVLGKTLTIAVMMGAMLKGDQALTIKINGNGPIGNVICDANANGEVRGYVDKPHVNFVNNKGGLNEELTLGTEGVIEVIKDLKLKDFFTSSIPLQNGNLAYDFTYYFTVSEQTPSMVSLGSLFEVDNKASQFGGIIIQLLPNAKDEVIDYLEGKSKELNSFSNLLKTMSLEEILELIFDKNFRILDKINVRFNCNCSKEKFARGIASLGAEEIQNIIDTDKHAECVCHYCKEVYDFNEEELREILKEVKENELSKRRNQKLYS